MQETVRFSTKQISSQLTEYSVLYAFEVLQQLRCIGAQYSTPSELFNKKVS